MDLLRAGVLKMSYPYILELVSLESFKMKKTSWADHSWERATHTISCLLSCSSCSSISLQSFCSSFSFLFCISWHSLHFLEDSVMVSFRAACSWSSSSFCFVAFFTSCHFTARKSRKQNTKKETHANKCCTPKCFSRETSGTYKMHHCCQAMTSCMS